MATAKLGQNDLCACCSGRKHKRCCLPRAALPAPAIPAGGSAAGIATDWGPPPPPLLTVEIDPASARGLRVQAQAPDSPTARHLQGPAAYRRQDYTAAANFIRGALAVCGWHPDYHYDLARTYEAIFSYSAVWRRLTY